MLIITHIHKHIVFVSIDHMMHSVSVYISLATHHPIKASFSPVSKLGVWFKASPPRSQLEKYRKRSSREMRMSVMRGGNSGSAQPSTLVHGWRMTGVVAQFLRFSGSCVWH